MDFRNLELDIDKDLEQEILLSAIEENVEKELQKEKTLKKSKIKSKKKRTKYSAATIRLKSGLKIKTVLLLLLTLIVNTYAWFIYISTVSMDISMHVKNWDFELSSGDLTENFEFIVDEIYPGMNSHAHEINARNNGETTAELSCNITYMKILGDEYAVGDTYEEDGETKIYDSQKLFEMLSSYPFKLEVFLDDIKYTGTPLPMSKDDSTKITFKVSWEYETGTDENTIEQNDVIDTYWGNEAYKYMQTNPDEYCIKVNVEIQAIQQNENP